MINGPPPLPPPINNGAGVLAPPALWLGHYLALPAPPEVPSMCVGGGGNTRRRFLLAQHSVHISRAASSWNSRNLSREWRKSRNLDMTRTWSKKNLFPVI